MQRQKKKTLRKRKTVEKNNVKLQKNIHKVLHTVTQIKKQPLCITIPLK